MKLLQNVTDVVVSTLVTGSLRYVGHFGSFREIHGILCVVRKHREAFLNPVGE